MVNEIRIYVEGGGESKDTKAFLREGMSKFLQGVREAARQRNVRWNIVVCGRRNAAVEGFAIALRQHANAFNILLVDSESAVQTGPWEHLSGRGEWAGESVGDEHCHLMAQVMEAWIIADIDALSCFYGDRFHAGPIPRNQNVEQISKEQIFIGLKAATRETQKGEYHKIRHGCLLLQRINPEVVRYAAPHCDRLFATLEANLER